MRNKTYNTIRDLERKNAGLFRAALMMGVIGLVMAALGAIPILLVTGIILITAAAILFFYGMILMIRLQKEPTRHIYCPYCASKNDVFISRREIPCDICGRRIGIPPSGEPIPLEPIEDEE